MSIRTKFFALTTAAFSFAAAAGGNARAAEESAVPYDVNGPCFAFSAFNVGCLEMDVEEARQTNALCEAYYAAAEQPCRAQMDKLAECLAEKTCSEGKDRCGQVWGYTALVCPLDEEDQGDEANEANEEGQGQDQATADEGEVDHLGGRESQEKVEFELPTKPAA